MGGLCFCYFFHLPGYGTHSDRLSGQQKTGGSLGYETESTTPTIAV
jgi:hypothetical protein